MPGSTLANTNVNAILQDNFGKMNSVINEFTVLVNQFDQSPKKLTGKRIEEDIRHGMPEGGGGVGPGVSAVPDPDVPRHSLTHIWPQQFIQTTMVDWDLEAQSRSNSYIDAVTDALKTVAMNWVQEHERMASSDGSGFLAQITVVIAVTNANWTFTVPRQFANRFRKGMRLAFWTGADNNAVKADNSANSWYTVSSVALGATTATVTITEPAGAGADPPATSDYAAKWGAISENATGSGTNAGNEMPGVAVLIDDGNMIVSPNTSAGWETEPHMQGINAATNSFWQSPTITASGSYLSIDLVEQAADEINVAGEGNGDAVRVIATHPFQIRKYRGELYPQERYPNSGTAGSFASGSKTSMKPGSGPMIADKRSVKCKYMDPSLAFLIGPGIYHYPLQPWGLKRYGGDYRIPTTDGRPADRMIAYCYKSLGIVRRTSSARIQSLDTTGIY